MNRHLADLILVSTLACVALGVALAGDGSVALRIFCTLPLVFVLPGYALVAAVFPNDTLARAERTLFTIGVSLAIAILGGLLLNLLPWGLQSTSWAVLLSCVTLLGCLVAMLRRPDDINQIIRPKLMLHPISLALFAIAALIAISGILSAHDQAKQLSQADVVQLWMLPSQSSSNIKTTNGSSTPNTIRIGVNSIGTQTEAYHLRLQRGGVTIRDWPAIELQANGSWEISLAEDTLGMTGEPIEAELYRADAPDVIYRHTSLWLNTSENSSKP